MSSVLFSWSGVLRKNKGPYVLNIIINIILYHLLIALGDEKSRRKANEKDEFDAFAQSRTASFDASKNR